MTAAALADAVDVDTTTVVRFAQRLGYPGYPELIEDIQEQVKLELSQTYAAPDEDGGLPSKVQALLAKDRAHLEKALAHNTPDTLEDIMDMLQAAPRIVVLGESYATPIAESFAGMLDEAGLPVVYANGDVYERAKVLGKVGRKQVIVGFSPLDGDSGVARVMRYARAQGAITLACTPNLSSQTARAAEHLLYAPGESENMPSLTALFAVCTALAQTLMTLQPEAIAKRRAETAHALSELA